EDDHEQQRDRAEAERDAQAGGKYQQGRHENQETDCARAHALAASMPKGAARPASTSQVSATRCRQSTTRPTGTDRYGTQSRARQMVAVVSPLWKTSYHQGIAAYRKNPQKASAIRLPSTLSTFLVDESTNIGTIS